MATSPTDQDKTGTLDPYHPLNLSVSSADDDHEDEDEQGDGTSEYESSTGTVGEAYDDKQQFPEHSAVPLGLIAELALSSKPKGKKGEKLPKDEDDADDSVVSALRLGPILNGMVDRMSMLTCFFLFVGRTPIVNGACCGTRCFGAV